MMVLAGLEQLRIRALFAAVSSSVALRRVALQVASAGAGAGASLASTVEQCLCPASYRGASCQVRALQNVPFRYPSGVGMAFPWV